jgi:hypothetical protein
MALDSNQTPLYYEAPEKDLYDMGEMPPMGYVPPKNARMGHPERAPRHARQSVSA